MEDILFLIYNMLLIKSCILAKSLDMCESIKEEMSEIEKPLAGIVFLYSDILTK